MSSEPLDLDELERQSRLADAELSPTHRVVAAMPGLIVELRRARKDHQRVQMCLRELSDARDVLRDVAMRLGPIGQHQAEKAAARIYEFILARTGEDLE